MIINSSKYHYKITWGVGGAQWDVVLQKPIELSRKPVTKEIFWRTESTEWVLLRWQNQFVYDKLISILADIEGTTYPIYALVHYYADGITFTKAEYAGTIAIDGIEVDKYAGKITLKPKPYDFYTWYDECKDNKISWKVFKGSTYLQKFISYSNVHNCYFTDTIKLSDLVKWICANCGDWKYPFESEFLTASVNPVTGEANRVAETFITLGYFGKIDARDWMSGLSYAPDQIVWRELDNNHASYFKCILDNTNSDPYFFPLYWRVYDPVDDDIVMEFQISDIFDLLKEEYNVYWYIDPYTVKTIFEHYKFFDNGLTYTGTPTVGVDFTDETLFPIKYHILKDFNDNYYKSVEYRFDEIVATNTYKYTASTHAPVVLVYDSLLAVKKKNNDETIGKMLGEIELFYDPENFDKVDDGSIMLLCADTSTPRIYLPMRTDGVKIGFMNALGQYYWTGSTTSTQNGACYLAYNWERYMIYGRELSKGMLDGAATTFLNIKPYKFQTLRFPRVLLESDYYELPLLVQTEIGIGRITEVKIMCDTGWAEIKVGFNYEE